MPPKAFVSGLLLNKDGDRCVNEDVYGARLAEQIMVKNEGNKGFLLIDSNLWSAAWSELFTNKEMLVFQKAFILLNLFLNRWKSMANTTGMDIDTLKATISHYNKDAKAGLDTQFGKKPELLHPLTKGPYYAIDFRPTGSWWVTPWLTLGGVETDNESSMVISRHTNEPIQGLYAAGRNASGVPCKSYVSGLSLSDCVFTGRRAGHHAYTKRFFGNPNC